MPRQFFFRSGKGGSDRRIRAWCNPWAEKFLCERSELRKFSEPEAGEAARGSSRTAVDQDRKARKETNQCSSTGRSAAEHPLGGHRRWPGRRAGGSPTGRRADRTAGVSLLNPELPGRFITAGEPRPRCPSTGGWCWGTDVQVGGVTLDIGVHQNTIWGDVLRTSTIVAALGLGAAPGLLVQSVSLCVSRASCARTEPHTGASGFICRLDYRMGVASSTEQRSCHLQGPALLRRSRRHALVDHPRRRHSDR